MANNHGSFIWYELMTSDAAGAKDFYDAVVGWDIDDAPVEGSPVDYRMIKRSDGRNAGGMLALTREMLDGGATPGWFGYIHTPDVDAAFARMVELGGLAFIEPHDMPGVGRIAFLADPQGMPIYLMAPTPPDGDPDAQSDVFSVDQPQHFRWNELWSSDAAATKALYGELFGWEQEGEMDMGPMGKYRFLQANGVGIGALCDAGKEGPGPRINYYIGVEDIDRAVETVKAKGGTVEDGPHEIPRGEFSLHGRDPQGAFFGLVGPRKG